MARNNGYIDVVGVAMGGKAQPRVVRHHLPKRTGGEPGCAG